MENLKIKGLRAAAAETRKLHDERVGHVQIGYNLRTGEVHANYLIGEDYRVYDDENVIAVYDYQWPMTMAGIKQTIIAAVEDHHKSA